MCDKSKAISYGLENIKTRMGNTEKPLVILIDGDKGLENKVREILVESSLSKQMQAIILDFIHVTEYIWKAANAHFGEKNNDRIEWVKQQSNLILESQTEQILINLDNIHKQNFGKIGKQNTIQKAIKYFSNHKHMMNYKLYLSKGYQISTGVIESACGHFVQNRMERNGMHWSLEGAQNMLNIRAVNKNRDWEYYMEHYINKGLNRNYGYDGRMVA